MYNKVFLTFLYFTGLPQALPVKHGHASLTIEFQLFCRATTPTWLLPGDAGTLIVSDVALAETGSTSRDCENTTALTRTSSSSRVYIGERRGNEVGERSTGDWSVLSPGEYSHLIRVLLPDQNSQSVLSHLAERFCIIIIKTLFWKMTMQFKNSILYLFKLNN